MTKSPTSARFGPSSARPAGKELDGRKEAERQNFELKMRVFYLEEKLGKLEDAPGVADPGNDAAVMLAEMEQELEVVKAELKEERARARQSEGMLMASDGDLGDLRRQNEDVVVMRRKLAQALEANAELVRQRDDTEKRRGELEAELNGNEGAVDLMDSYREQNKRLKADNDLLLDELEEVREKKQQLGELVRSLREDLAEAAKGAPEDTGPEMSEAVSRQLETYQVRPTCCVCMPPDPYLNPFYRQDRAASDAQSLGEAVERLEQADAKAREQREEIEQLRRAKSDLEKRSVHRDAELAASKAAHGDPLSSFLLPDADPSSVREVLSSQGRLAATLAEKEMELAAALSSGAASAERASKAEQHAAQMAEQLRLIQESSEEVALLEAEEISRLEGELAGMHGIVAEEKEAAEARRREVEGVRGEMGAEIEALKEEVLRLKRSGNEAAEGRAKLGRVLGKAPA
jgi:hypothetical protein